MSDVRPMCAQCKGREAAQGVLFCSDECWFEHLGKGSLYWKRPCECGHLRRGHEDHGNGAPLRRMGACLDGWCQCQQFKGAAP